MRDATRGRSLVARRDPAHIRGIALGGHEARHWFDEPFAPLLMLRVPRNALVVALALVAGAQLLAAQATPRPSTGASSDRWWKEGVVYQVYPRSFQDSDGNGVGDLRGITQRLDYLKDLGVNTLWISPFFPSPMRDFGYDISNYVGVDTTFGTMADFDALVRAAHARGLHVVLDFVANHSSDQHPWFVESRSSRTSPRRDWYIWRDPAPNGGPPNNWLSVFGGSGWTLDSTTHQYYFHQFLAAQPDLNWRNPALQRAMLEAMRFWLDRGADGFRLDAFKHLVEDARFRDNSPDTSGSTGHGQYDSLLPIHTTDDPKTLDVLCQMRRVGDGYARRDNQARLLIVEAYGTPEKVAPYYGGRNGCGAQLPSNFGLLGAPWKAETIQQRITEYMRTLPAGRWPNWVFGNHDNSRLATRLGPDAARAAAVLLLTLPGTPTIYYGDELGMQDVPIPRELVQDPAEQLQPGLGIGRDPERTPMQWSATPNGGFSTGTPWLPLATSVQQVNVASEQADSNSMLALYERLLRLKRDEPALSHGTFRLLPRQGEVIAHLRQHGTTSYLVLVNVGKSPATYALAAADVKRLSGGGTVATVAAGTHSRAAGARLALDTVALEANEAVAIRIGPK